MFWRLAYDVMKNSMFLKTIFIPFPNGEIFQTLFWKWNVECRILNFINSILSFLIFQRQIAKNVSNFNILNHLLNVQNIFSWFYFSQDHDHFIQLCRFCLLNDAIYKRRGQWTVLFFNFAAIKLTGHACALVPNELFIFNLLQTPTNWIFSIVS